MKFLPTIGDSLSGKMGGIVASRNSSGAYFRVRADPVNPNSQFQQQVRGWFGGGATAWRGTLSQAQRDGWKTYAENTPVQDRIGNTITLPPLSWYNAKTVLQQQAGVPVTNDPPTLFGLTDLTEPVVQNLSAAAGTFNVQFDNTQPWAITTGGALLVFASRPQSPSVNFFKGPYRFAGAVLGNTATPPTSPATLNFPFGVAAGQRVFFSIRAVDAGGRISQRFRGFGTVA